MFAYYGLSKRFLLYTGILTLALAFSASCHVAQAQAQSVADVVPENATPKISPLSNGIDVQAGHHRMLITALTDDILRVRVMQKGVWPENASWAVPSAVRAQNIAVTATTDGFQTRKIRLRIVGSTGRIVIEDLQGHVISADADVPVTTVGRGFTLQKQLPISEHIFAMGDKTGPDLDRRGMTYVNWNTDSFAFTRATDPIYKSIPFFIGMGGPGGGYGLFLDNSWRTWFDFGHKDENVTAFGAPDGPIDYYFIHGPSTAEVVRRYTDLTGRPSLPPLWSLGYQQSRYSYETAAEVRDIATRLRSDRIPTDVLWLDIDFQDRNRPFTTDHATFPDLKGLIGQMGKDGFKVVTITDLHIAQATGQGYAPYDSGVAQDRFVHRGDGSVYVAPVWPGPSLFPDFTQASTRRWWGDLFAGELADGVAGSWNDMNEPAIFETRTKTMPLDVQHRIDGDDFASRITTHAEIHNVYGMENSRATYEGLARLAPDKRPFVMTRASFAGGQRYAVTWTGDNSATWDHLKLSIHQILNLGLSGFAYSAADVSGFAGGPNPDLLTRWFEIGAFYPIFRDHSAKGTPHVEPWVDGPEHLALRRRFIEERYRLLPYFYALADQNATVGDPIMRPVFYDYPDVVGMSCDQSMSFTVGRSLLVAPPPNPESPQSYGVCLPAGGWFDYWTGLPVNGKPLVDKQPIQSASQATDGGLVAGQTIIETPRLDHLPVYVRSGTILPRQPLVQTTSETPNGPLQLDVYPGQDCRGDLYTDAGDGVAYRKGDYLRQKIRCSVADKTLYLNFETREGRYVPWWHKMRVVVHGWRGQTRVTRGTARVKSESDEAAQTLTFTLPDQPKKVRVAISAMP